MKNYLQHVRFLSIISDQRACVLLVLMLMYLYSTYVHSYLALELQNINFRNTKIHPIVQTNVASYITGE